MGGRYLITGAQIGTLEALAKENKDVKGLLESIQKQYIGESTLPVDEDVKAMENFFDTQDNVRVEEGDEVTAELNDGDSAEIESDGDLDIDVGEEDK